MNTQPPKPQHHTKFSDVYGLPTMNEDEKQRDRKSGLWWLALIVLAIPLCWLWLRPKTMSAYTPRELGEKIYAQRITSVKFQQKIYLDVAPPPEQGHKRAWQHAQDNLIDDGASKKSSTQVLQAAMERIPMGARPNVAEVAYLSTDSGWKKVWVVGVVWRTLPRDNISDSASVAEKQDHHERQRRFWFAFVDGEETYKVLATCAREKSKTPAGQADNVQVLGK